MCVRVQVSLLASGRLLYHGLCDEMVPWFESVGYTYTPGERTAGQDSHGHLELYTACERLAQQTAVTANCMAGALGFDAAALVPQTCLP